MATAESMPAMSPVPVDVIAEHVPAVAQAQANAAATQTWQRNLLPYFRPFIALLAVFFLGATFFQLYSLQSRIERAPTLEIEGALALLGNDAAALSTSERLMFVQWRTLAALEKHVLDRRYHQVNVMLMARTWTRYLGFLTGMIMAFVGALFILGKFQESETSLQVSSTPVKAALRSSSPGLVLATLGTALMMATILMHTDITSNDGNEPLYVKFILSPSDNAAAAAPAPLPNMQAAPPTPDELLRDAAARPNRQEE